LSVSFARFVRRPAEEAVRLRPWGPVAGLSGKFDPRVEAEEEFVAGAGVGDAPDDVRVNEAIAIHGNAVSAHGPLVPLAAARVRVHHPHSDGAGWAAA
jgi:hypothetical protein